MGDQGPELQERVTYWCPRCQAARSPIDPAARTGEPGRPRPVATPG
jgi:endonuclease-8